MCRNPIPQPFTGYDVSVLIHVPHVCFTTNSKPKDEYSMSIRLEVGRHGQKNYGKP